MKLILLALLIMIQACTLSRCSQNPEDRPGSVDFDKHFSISSKLEPQTSTLSVTVTLDPGFHAYAEGEEIGRPVSLRIEPKNGWTPDGPPLLPEGKRRDLNDLGQAIVLEGNFDVRQKMRSGTGPGEATLSLQICTKSLCDRPRNHMITWH